MARHREADDSQVFYRLLNLSAVVSSGHDSANWVRDLLPGHAETLSSDTLSTTIQSPLLIPHTELESLQKLAPDQFVGVAELIKQFPEELIIVDTDEGENREDAIERIHGSLTARGKLVQRLPTSIDAVTRGPSRQKTSSSLTPPSQSTNMATRAKKQTYHGWHPGRLIGRSANVKNLRLLIDTSALMSVDMQTFCDETLIPWATDVLNTEGVAVITVPREVLRELETMSKLASPPDNPKRQQYAIAGLQHLNTLHQLGVLQLAALGHAGEKQAADDVFGPLILQLLLEFDVLFMAQDRRLRELCNKQYEVMAESVAFTGRKRRFAACRLLNNGRLVLHSDPPAPSPPPSNNAPRANTPSTPKRPSQPKTAPPKLRQLDQTPLLASPHPKAHGDEVLTDDGQHFQICHPGMAGGEGVVYLLKKTPEHVAKIYHPDQLQQWRFEKLQLMIANPVRNRAVAWPSSLLSNVAGQPVGFLMPRVDAAVPLVDSAFSAALLEDQFPHWRRRHLVILARNLARVVMTLHQRSEVIGDLNPANILVHEEDGEPRVKLVDCDSWQFEEFPSPVGMPEYTHPDLRGKNFNHFLRSQEHDLFALAILIFQILFVGRHPFSNKGEQSLAEAMQAWAFSYPLGRHDNEDRDKTPKGFPFKVWTHLPWPVQEAFYNGFSGKQCITAAEWSNKLSDYLLDIDHDRLDALGNANRIKPTAVRVPKGRTDDVSEVLHCQEPDCNNTEEYFGAEVIARKKAMRFFRCQKCQDLNRLRNQQGASRLCQACATVFSHPIWFEEMLETNGHTIETLCPQHGGLRSEFQCSDCGWTWHERSIERWQTVNNISEPRCVRCLGKQRRSEGTSFKCARCSTTFQASGAVAQLLSEKPAKWVLCFDCNAPGRAATPKRARSKASPPRPKHKMQENKSNTQDSRGAIPGYLIGFFLGAIYVGIDSTIGLLFGALMSGPLGAWIGKEIRKKM